MKSLLPDRLAVEAVDPENRGKYSCVKSIILRVSYFWVNTKFGPRFFRDIFHDMWLSGCLGFPLNIAGNLLLMGSLYRGFGVELIVILNFAEMAVHRA
jgi:hypothetical protein